MADQIKKIIGNIFIKYYTKINQSIITVTNVKVSSDLKLAKIYISIYNQNNINLSDNEFINIKNNRNLFRYHLGVNLASKYVPKIQFFEDEQYKLYDQINKITKNA